MTAGGKKIKVLHLIETLGMGGAENNLLNVLKYMNRELFYNKVLYLYDRNELKENFKAIGIEASCAKMKNIYDFAKGLKAIVKEIRKGDYDIIHTQLFAANIYGRIAALLTGKKVITTLQNPDYSFEGGGLLGIRKVVDRITIAAAKTKFIAVSDTVKRSFIKELSLPEENIEVINNSFDPDRLKGLNSGAGVAECILAIGRLHEQKGHRYLLEAFKKIADRITGTDLVIIGEGPLKEELISASKRLGIEKRTFFPGNIGDVTPYLKKAAIFVFPSLYEGLPVALVEAMAAGVPCIASDIDPIREIDGGRGAILLVKPGDTAALAMAVERLLSDAGLRRKMIGEAALIVDERFDARKNSLKVEGYFRRAAERAPKARCPLCGSSNSRVSIFGGYRYRGAEYRLTRCRDCGFLYINPMPQESVFKEMYGAKSYFKNYWVRNSKTLGYIEGKDAAINNAAATLKIINRYKSAGSIIDIGSSGGHFLAKAKEMGYVCKGVEPNPEMAEYAGKAYGLDIIAKDFSEACATIGGLGKFDIVYMGDTLEHMPDPHLALDLAKKVMTGRSILAIEGPMDFNRSLHALTLAVNMFFKRDRLSGNPPYHVSEFNGKTMRYLLERNGFDITDMRITEDAPRFVAGIDGTSVKERARRCIKGISGMISNSPIMKWLGMGDRVLVIARLI